MQENLQLNNRDLTDLLSGLTGDNYFSGYLRMDLPGSKKGYVFVAGGQKLRAFEFSEEGTAKFYTTERLFAKAGEEGVPCSTYAMNSEMANLLAMSFAFETGMDWKSQFQNDKHTGFALFGDEAVLFSKGHPLQGVMTNRYGQLVCGRETIHKLLEEGRPTKAYGGQPVGLESMAKRLQHDLERLREVQLKSVSGFFATKDHLKVEAGLAQEWGVKGTWMTVVEDLNGRRVGALKTTVGCKKPGVMEIPLKVMQEWHLAEDQSVMVYPQD